MMETYTEHGMVADVTQQIKKMKEHCSIRALLLRHHSLCLVCHFKMVKRHLLGYVLFPVIPILIPRQMIGLFG